MQPDFTGSPEIVREPIIYPDPAPPREPFWGWVDFLLFIGIGIAILFLVCVPVVLLMQARGELAGPNLVLVGLGIQAVLYAAIYFSLKIVFASRYRKPVFRSLGWRHSAFLPPYAAVAGIVLALVVAGLMHLLHVPEVPSPVDALVTSRLTLIVVAVMAAVAAPIFEEALFRGFLQPLLCRTLGTIVGIVLTGALFGALHLSEYLGVWQYAAAITFVGVVFGWVRYRTDSLVPSTVMHACFNGVSVIALVASKYASLK